MERSRSKAPAEPQLQTNTCPANANTGALNTAHYPFTSCASAHNHEIPSRDEPHNAPVRSAQHLQDRALERLGHGPEAHGACDGDDLIKGDVAGVLHCASTRHTKTKGEKTPE